MNKKQHRLSGHRQLVKTRRLLASAVLCSAMGATVWGQTDATGLNALGEDRLLSELAGRGLDNLLDHAFTVGNVSKEKREGVLTFTALRELTNPAAKMTPRQRQEAVRRVVAGIERALPTLRDPRQLMQQASVLITEGAMRDVNTLEYWGENPQTQAQLRPVMETVDKILDKCAAEATAIADRIVNQVTNNITPAQQAEWTAMDNLANSARFTKAMASYYTCLSIDATDPKRKDIAAKALEDLKPFDNSQSGVQPVIRNRMAKLLMVKGDHSAARKMFASVLSDTAIAPAPEIDQQYEARYFSAVCDLMDKNLGATTKALEELKTWQKTNLPQDKSAQDGAEAAADMLQYRIYLAAEAAAASPADKQTAADNATKTLLGLQDKQPALRGIIATQLISRMKEDADVATLNPLLLQAVIQRADQERLKPDGETVNQKAIERGILAAREMVKRKGQAGATEDLLDSASLLIPLFLDRLGRSAEAAEGFLDYIQNPTGSLENKNGALDNAMTLIGQLRKADPSDPVAAKVYERLLPIAIAKPFNRKEFAFEYGQRLQRLGNYTEAITYYQQVPASDKRYLHARFYETLAIQQEMDTNGAKLDKAAKEQLTANLLKRSNQVNHDAKAAMAAAATDADRKNFKRIVIKTALLSAEAVKESDPRRTLQILTGFEDLAKGMPGESDLLASACSCGSAPTWNWARISRQPKPCWNCSRPNPAAKARPWSIRC